jgi:hypothetical protein
MSSSSVQFIQRSIHRRRRGSQNRINVSQPAFPANVTRRSHNRAVRRSLLTPVQTPRDSARAGTTLRDPPSAIGGNPARGHAVRTLLLISRQDITWVEALKIRRVMYCGAVLDSLQV